ncbi:hypothetical protein KCU90_g7660, partial [Aureobasidium melanogenum]
MMSMLCAIELSIEGTRALGGGGTRTSSEARASAGASHFGQGLPLRRNDPGGGASGSSAGVSTTAPPKSRPFRMSLFKSTAITQSARMPRATETGTGLLKPPSTSQTPL